MSTINKTREKGTTSHAKRLVEALKHSTFFIKNPKNFKLVHLTVERWRFLFDSGFRPAFGKVLILETAKQSNVTGGAFMRFIWPFKFGHCKLLSLVKADTKPNLPRVRSNQKIAMKCLLF